MTEAVAKKTADPGAEITLRPDAGHPIFEATGRDTIAVRAGAVLLIAGERIAFPAQLELAASPGALVPGTDYAVLFGFDNAPYVDIWREDEPLPRLGGFHFAPGGNAPARAGGDDIPAINPLSIWDLGFRPACRDPRGMAYVAGVPGSEHVPGFWSDIYLTGVEHLTHGTSAFGVEIADGHRAKPTTVSGDREAKLDYATGKRIVEGHGKGLMSFAEFAAATYGVTEKTAHDSEPENTGLDAARTSRIGAQQATGNMWVWGHDGDPDEPRASILGGSWLIDDDAGSRCASVGDWPGYSGGGVGVRGRSDHLQLV